MPLFQDLRHQAGISTNQQILEAKMALTVSTRIKVAPKTYMVTFCFPRTQVIKLGGKYRVKVVLLSQSNQIKDLQETVKILMER
jgi:hypothetical protein